MKNILKEMESGVAKTDLIYLLARFGENVTEITENNNPLTREEIQYSVASKEEFVIKHTL